MPINKQHAMPFITITANRFLNFVARNFIAKKQINIHDVSIQQKFLLLD